MYKKLFLALAGISLSAGCGGGSGTNAPVTTVYSGSTVQATVTTTNAKSLSEDAFFDSQLTFSVSVSKVTTEKNNHAALLRETAVILENSVSTIVGAPRSPAKAVAATAQNTSYGYSGSASYSITYDQKSGSFNGLVTFSQYAETSTSATLSGPVSFSGVYNQATGSFTSMNMSMSSLTGIDGGESFTLSGNMSTSTGGATETMAMSVVIADNVSGRTYWMKDFTFALTGGSLSVTGTYYNPDDGYVVISTVTPLAVTDFEATPTSGRLLFSGSNGTKARLTFTSSGSTVEADTIGNGTYVVVP